MVEMTSLVQELLHDDVRFILIGAALFVGCVVIVFLMVGLRSRRRAEQQKLPSGRDDAPDKGAMMSLLDGGAGEGPSSEEAQGAAGPAVLQEVGEIAEARGAAPEEEDHRDALIEEIGSLEREGHMLDAARQCNALAEMAIKRSDMEEAREYFSKGLSLADLGNDGDQSGRDAETEVRAVQAVSRSRLGDIFKINGDLTSACEYWQLARSLYAACGEDDKMAEVEEKMSGNQCPTDWVLNEF